MIYYCNSIIWMEMEKSKVLIQFLLFFRQFWDVLFFPYARGLRGYTATPGPVWINWRPKRLGWNGLQQCMFQFCRHRTLNYFKQHIESKNQSVSVVLRRPWQPNIKAVPAKKRVKKFQSELYKTVDWRWPASFGSVLLCQFKGFFSILQSFLQDRGNIIEATMLRLLFVQYIIKRLWNFVRI